MMLGPLQGALLAAGDAGADEVQVVLAQRRLAPAGVLEVGVAAVDDDVARLQVRDQLVDHRVGGGAGLDHDDDPARALRLATNCSIEDAGRKLPSSPCSSMRWSVLAWVRLKRATVCPGWRSCGRGCCPSRPAPSPRPALVRLFRCSRCCLRFSDLHRRPSSCSIRSVAACQRPDPVGSLGGWAGPERSLRPGRGAPPASADRRGRLDELVGVGLGQVDRLALHLGVELPEHRQAGLGAVGRHQTRRVEDALLAVERLDVRRLADALVVVGRHLVGDLPPRCAPGSTSASRRRR